jgi:hypothetical protein
MILKFLGSRPIMKLPHTRDHDEHVNHVNKPIGLTPNEAININDNSKFVNEERLGLTKEF